MSTQRRCRREFLIAIATITSIKPLRLWAQQSRTLPLVAVLALRIELRTAAFRAGLQDLGYVDGRNIKLEEHLANDHEQLARVAERLVHRQPDVIVAMGTTTTEITKKATSTIPIVTIIGVDPVKAKLAISLGRPGGNVTGVVTVLEEAVSKRLELAREAFPGLNRLGALWNPKSQASVTQLAEAQKAAKTLNLQLHAVTATSADEFDEAFERLARARTNVFVLMSSSMASANRQQLINAAVKHRILGIFPAADWVEAGGLLAYGASASEPYRMAATYVTKILAGSKPGELPIEEVRKLELTINLKTARELGVRLPNMIQIRADRVIE